MNFASLLMHAIDFGPGCLVLILSQLASGGLAVGN